MLTRRLTDLIASIARCFFLSMCVQHCSSTSTFCFCLDHLNCHYHARSLASGLMVSISVNS